LELRPKELTVVNSDEEWQQESVNGVPGPEIEKEAIRLSIVSGGSV
jgi:hypothetical protein